MWGKNPTQTNKKAKQQKTNNNHKNIQTKKPQTLLTAGNFTDLPKSFLH